MRAGKNCALAPPRHEVQAIAATKVTDGCNILNIGVPQSPPCTPRAGPVGRALPNVHVSPDFFRILDTSGNFFWNCRVLGPCPDGPTERLRSRNRQQPIFIAMPRRPDSSHRLWRRRPLDGRQTSSGPGCDRIRTWPRCPRSRGSTLQRICSPSAASKG